MANMLVFKPVMKYSCGQEYNSESGRYLFEGMQELGVLSGRVTKPNEMAPESREAMANGRTAAPLQIGEIRAFTLDWYGNLGEHVPAHDFMSLVLDQGLEFVVPDAILRSIREFGDWHAGGDSHPGMVNLCFNKMLTLCERRDDDRQAAHLGQDDRRQPAGPVLAPASRSHWSGLDAFQTWNMICSPETRKPLIGCYVADEL
jgi:hypothetical protein